MREQLPEGPGQRVWTNLKPGEHYGSLWVWTGVDWEVLLLGASPERIHLTEAILLKAFEACQARLA